MNNLFKIGIGMVAASFPCWLLAILGENFIYIPIGLLLFGVMFILFALISVI